MKKTASFLSMVGGLLLLASTFMPVVDISFETLNLWHSLVNTVAYGRPIAILLSLAGIVPFVTMIFFRHPAVHLFSTLLAGISGTAAACIFLSRTVGKGIQGYGLYVMLAAGLLLLLSAIFSFFHLRKTKQQPL